LKVATVWRHIDNDPKEELKYCAEKRPLLQDPNNGQILPALKAKKSENDRWVQELNAVEASAKLGELISELIHQHWNV
jgi:hypothetical protein